MARLTQMKMDTLPRPMLGIISKARNWKGAGKFCVRYRLDDPALTASIRKFGILAPAIVLKTKKGLRVLSGHKRLYAARKLRRMLPLVELGTVLPGRGALAKISDKEAFVFALVANWRQEFSEMDRARAVAKAVREFKLTGEEVRETVLPLLGLPSESRLTELYLGADRLPVILKNLVHDKQVPFRACAALARFSPADQRAFARMIASGVRLTSSQCLQAVEWISDIAKRDGAGLTEMLKRSAFREIVRHRRMDPRTKADRFYSLLKRKRFPKHEARLAEFEKRSGALGHDGQVRIEPAAGFEEPGIDLRARLRTFRELDRLLEKLSENRPALNSLFDFTL